MALSKGGFLQPLWKHYTPGFLRELLDWDPCQQEPLSRLGSVQQSPPDSSESERLNVRKASSGVELGGIQCRIAPKVSPKSV